MLAFCMFKFKLRFLERVMRCAASSTFMSYTEMYAAYKIKFMQKATQFSVFAYFPIRIRVSMRHWSRHVALHCFVLHTVCGSEVEKGYMYT